MMNWRLIITPDVHARLNMALDEVLLRSVRPQHPTLRLYSWNPPGISLGHFQQVSAEGIGEWERRGFVLVRRLTGGGAIVHQGDLTYSIALAGLAEAGLSQPAELYDLAHTCFARALQELGIETRIRGGNGVHRSFGFAQDKNTFFCSERESAHDLMFAGKKMMGSAQRRRGEALLQQGALPLARNTIGEDVISASEAAGRKISFNDFAMLLKDAFARTLCADFVTAQFTPDDWEAGRRLAEEKYSQVQKIHGGVIPHLRC